MNFAGHVLTVTLLPFAGFVKVFFKAPLDRMIMDPSAVLSSFWNCLLTSCVPWTSNPQNSAGTVKVGGKSRNSHPSPRPPARAGAAVATPPDHAQQRAERHDYSESPHGDHPLAWGNFP